jgi:uncharacterized OsmC-like protein
MVCRAKERVRSPPWQLPLAADPTGRWWEEGLTLPQLIAADSNRGDEMMASDTVKQALSRMMEALKQNPTMANVVFRAQTRLEENVRCTAKVRDFDPMTIDEPPELGGANAGMNPVELLLVSLGTCQEIAYAAYASLMGIELEEVRVDLKGHLDLHGLFGLDENIPAGYRDIHFETNIKSREDPEKIKQLVDLVESHCPVLDTLTRKVQASGKAYLNSSELSSFSTE